MEINTSQEIQIVNSRVAHMTIGDAITTKGRKRVLQKEIWSQ